MEFIFLSVVECEFMKLNQPQSVKLHSCEDSLRSLRARRRCF